MVHHIVSWNFNETLTETEKKQAALTMKEKLEAVAQTVDGVISLKVVINEMASSNRDIALISSFADQASLEAYQVSPAHVEAGKFVRSVTCNRSCIDYEESYEKTF